MRFLDKLVNNSNARLEADAERTMSPKMLKQGDIVRHRLTNRLGRVTLTGVMTGSLRLPIISVEFEDGKVACQVPAEDFTFGFAKDLAPQVLSEIGPEVLSTPEALPVDNFYSEENTDEFER